MDFDEGCMDLDICCSNKMIHGNYFHDNKTCYSISVHLQLRGLDLSWSVKGLLILSFIILIFPFKFIYIYIYMYAGARVSSR